MGRLTRTQDVVVIMISADNIIETQIQGDLKENPTGQALADLIHKEQKILAKEVRQL